MCVNFEFEKKAKLEKNIEQKKRIIIFILVTLNKQIYIYKEIKKRK